MDSDSPVRRFINRNPLLVGFLCLCLTVSGAIYYTNRHAIDSAHHADQTAIEQGRLAQLAGCKRLQVQRDQSNGLDILFYDALVASAKRNERLASAARDPAARRTARKTIRQTRAFAAKMLVTRPTNCDRAVNDPQNYVAPQPIFLGQDGPEVDAARASATATVKAATARKKAAAKRAAAKRAAAIKLGKGLREPPS